MGYTLHVCMYSQCMKTDRVLEKGYKSSVGTTS